MVEVHPAGAGGCGSQLPDCQSVPAHHSDQRPALGLLWDPRVDGSLLVYSPCKIQSDSLHSRVFLLGMGTMVGADILAERGGSSSGSDVLIGDILVLLGASLYAVSNGCEEYIVKKLSRQEFLGMVGLFGTIISGIQLLIVEPKDIASVHCNWKIILLFMAFALCMFCLYSFMPLLIKVTSAVSVNLGILTADLCSLSFGLFLFKYKFSGLYLLSFTVFMVGFILYCSTPTRTAEPAESSVPPILPALGSITWA